MKNLKEKADNMATDKIKKENNTKTNVKPTKPKQTKSNTNNKKSNNKMLIGILIVLLILLLFGLFELFEVTKKEEEPEIPDVIEHSQEYEKIMDMDFQKNYPTGYLEVVEANNELVMYEYGEEIQLGEATNVLTKQRELFATELNELNPIETQVNKYIEDVTNYRSMGRFVVDRKILTSEILSYDGTVAQVIVDESFNDGLLVQYTYNLIKENDEWKIFSWERRVVKSAEVEVTEGTDTTVEQK